MESKIEDLKDHYILCGAGETGTNAIKQFQRSKVPFIVIESDENKVSDLMDQKIFAIHGDATLEYTLNKARIQYAKGLISSLKKDADNVYTVLTAREMNKDLYIVSRAVEKNGTSDLVFNPNSNEILNIGDTLIVLGREDQVLNLRKLAKDSGNRSLEHRI